VARDELELPDLLLFYMMLGVEGAEGISGEDFVWVASLKHLSSLIKGGSSHSHESLFAGEVLNLICGNLFCFINGLLILGSLVDGMLAEMLDLVDG
jgi:hypothetical protein